MKKNFLKRLFGYKSDRNIYLQSLSTRVLGLEPLESRQMLSADWGNFDTPVEILELPTLPGGSCDLIQFADINGDNKDDYIAVDFSANTVSVFYGDDSGIFAETADKTTTLSNAGMGSADNGIAVIFGKFNEDNGDGKNDLAVITGNSNDGSMTVSVYSSNSDGSFNTTAKDYTINENVYSGGVYTYLNACVNSDTSKLVIQMEYISISGSGIQTSSRIDGWDYNIADIATNPFGSTSTNYYNDTSTGRSLLNIINAEYNGESEEFIVTKGEPNSTGSTSSTDYVFEFKALSLSGSLYHTTTWNYENSDLGIMSVEWLISDNETGNLIIGGNRGINNFISTISLGDLNGGDSFAPVIANNAMDFSLGNTSSAITWNKSEANVDDPVRLLYVKTSNRLVVLEGEDFTPLSTVENPNFHTSFITDIIGPDGCNDIFMVDSTSLWIYNGKTGDYNVLKELGTNLTQASFLKLNGTDFGVAVMSEGGTSVTYYLIQTSDNGATFSVVPSKIFYITLENRNYQILDMATGDFTGDGKEDVALLGTFRDASTNSRAVAIFGADQTTPIYAEAFSITGTDEINAISAGQLYADTTGKDEIVLTKFTNSTASLLIYKYSTTLELKNTLVVQSSNANSAGDKITIVVDKVNNDEYNDLVYLYSSFSGQSKLGYFYNSADNLFTEVVLQSNLVSGTAWSGLFYGYVNEDEYEDIIIVGTSSQQTSIYTLLGTTSGFESTLLQSADSASISGFGATAISVGKLPVNGAQDNSNDVLIVNGSEAYVWNNKAITSGSCGRVTVLCQSLSKQSTTGTNFDSDAANARTWIDEWSNFFMDVWGTTEGTGAITSFSVKLTYNPLYFSVLSGTEGYIVLPGSENITITSTEVSSDGYIVVSGTAANLVSTGNTLLARIRFTPNKADGAGVALPEDGIFASVNNDFHVDVNKSTLNGMSILSAQAPEIPLYPVVFDLDDSGFTNILDFSKFLVAYDLNTSTWPEAKPVSLKICDFTNNEFINLLDFSAFLVYYDRSINTTSDSLYNDNYQYFPQEVSESELTVALQTTVSEDSVSSKELNLSLESPIVQKSYLYAPILGESNKSKSIFGTIDEQEEAVAGYDVVDEMVTDFLNRATAQRTLGTSESNGIFAFLD